MIGVNPDVLPQGFVCPLDTGAKTLVAKKRIVV
jgi:hypothetical protein